MVPVVQVPAGESARGRHPFVTRTVQMWRARPFDSLSSLRVSGVWEERSDLRLSARTPMLYPG